MTRTIRPRRGDLEAAPRPHAPVPSGEYATHEICDLCGFSFPHRLMHPPGLKAGNPPAGEPSSDSRTPSGDEESPG